MLFFSLFLIYLYIARERIARTHVVCIYFVYVVCVVYFDYFARLLCATLPGFVFFMVFCLFFGLFLVLCLWLWWFVVVFCVFSTRR